MKKLLVAALMVVLASPAAFAAIQNVKVSGDITSSWIYNNSLDLGATDSNGLPAYQKHQNVFLTQTRLRVDADLSDNVSTTVGLINERAWNAENDASGSLGYANDTDVQLYLASLTLREFLYSPLTLQIGRQVFSYGNGFILGDGGPINSGSANLASIYADLNERTAYDGVTATLDYKPLTISLIYMKYGQNLNSVDGVYVSNPQQSEDVYGYNANYQLSDPWSTVVEQYMFARIAGSGFTSTLAGGTNGGDAMAGEGKGNTLFVPGLRASTNPTKNLNLQGEIAWELGNQDVCTGTCTTPGNSDDQGEHRDAMAAQVLATYTLPVLEKYKPSVNASWTYVSGDKNGNANYGSNGHTSSASTYTAWDEFNTIQGAGTIYRAIFPMSNESIVEVGASASPLEDVTASATWSGLWAPQAISAFNQQTILQPDGTGVTAGPIGAQRAHWIGNETDLGLTYNYTEDVTFGLTVGWFVPGDVFSSELHDTASQAIANVGVKF